MGTNPSPSYREDPARVVEDLHVVTWTPSVPTDAQDDNDVIAATEEIANVAREPGGTVELVSAVVLDGSDTGAGLDLVFLDANVAVGTEDAAVSISDANAASIVGILSVPSTYVDLINSQMQVVKDIGLVMKCPANSTSLYGAVIARDAITPGAVDAIKIKLGFRRA